MGYIGKYEEKIKAQRLRKRGLSYKEILIKINVSKDTISRWCRDIELTERQKTRLMDNRIFGQKKGSIKAAENKKKLRLENINSIHKTALREVGFLHIRDRFIAGIALYAGEGSKTDRQIGFANSNPALIRFMMDWFRVYCKIPEEKYRGAIWIHEGLNIHKAKQFWSKITGIPQFQFYKTYIAKNKKSTKKIRKNIHQYGVFSIRVNSSSIHRRLIGWIYALFNDRITSVH